MAEVYPPHSWVFFNGHNALQPGSIVYNPVSQQFGLAFADSADHQVVGWFHNQWPVSKADNEHLLCLNQARFCFNPEDVTANNDMSPGQLYLAPSGTFLKFRRPGNGSAWVDVTTGQSHNEPRYLHVVRSWSIKIPDGNDFRALLTFPPPPALT